MELNYKDILTTFMVLFAVIDIIGNIPIIIDLRKKAGHIQSEKASLIAGFILIIFLFIGEQLLSIIGLRRTFFRHCRFFGNIFHCIGDDFGN